MTDVFLKNETDTMLDCGHPKSVNNKDVGYGRDNNGKTFCYECCGKNDKIWMDGGNHQVLYLEDLTKEEKDKIKESLGAPRYEGKWFATNWPNTMRIPVKVFKQKRRYSARGFPIDRINVYFTWNKIEWYGTVGNFNTGSCFIARPFKEKK